MNKRLFSIIGSIILLASIGIQPIYAGDFWNSQAGSVTRDALREIDRAAGNYIDQKEREMKELQKIIDTPIPAKGNMDDDEYKAQLDDLQSRKNIAQRKLERLEGHAEWAENAMKGLVGSFMGNIQDSM